MIINALLFKALLILAAISDVLTLTIPNWLCALLAALFLPAALLVHMPLMGLASHLACSFAVLAASFLLFQFGWFGGGDAKLAAATALWLGWGSLPVFLLQTAIWGGALSLLLLLLRSLHLPPTLARQSFIARLADPAGGAPYGVALAIGGLLAFPNSTLWRLSGGA